MLFDQLLLRIDAAFCFCFCFFIMYIFSSTQILQLNSLKSFFFVDFYLHDESKGGFVAVQYALAYSAAVRAFGAIAGGPYFCAQGSASTAATACGSGLCLLA